MLVVSGAPEVAFAQSQTEQSAPVPGASDPGIIVKHGNFSNGITLTLKCDIHDAESSVAGCHDAIGSRRLQLGCLKMRLVRGGSTKEFDAHRLIIEQQITDFAASLKFIRVHPEKFSAQPPRKRFGYLYSPSSMSLPPYGGNVANYSGDENAVAVPSVPQACSFRPCGRI